MTQKIVKVSHAVGTLNVSAAGGGDPRDVLDEKVNNKLVSEGWDDVQMQVVHLNKAGEEVTSVMILYKYVKYGEDQEVAKKK